MTCQHLVNIALLISNIWRVKHAAAISWLSLFYEYITSLSYIFKLSRQNVHVCAGIILFVVSYIHYFCGGLGWMEQGGVSIYLFDFYYYLG